MLDGRSTLSPNLHGMCGWLAMGQTLLLAGVNPTSGGSHLPLHMSWRFSGFRGGVLPHSCAFSKRHLRKMVKLREFKGRCFVLQSSYSDPPFSKGQKSHHPFQEKKEKKGRRVSTPYLGEDRCLALLSLEVSVSSQE